MRFGSNSSKLIANESQCAVRLWTVHPQYLDAKGLVALWREGLLAQKVLKGETKGYRNHPQLNRFKAMPNPVVAIRRYLYFVYQDALARDYNFDLDKIGVSRSRAHISATTGQMEFERQHLLAKLEQRDRPRYDELRNISRLEPHPMFAVEKGAIADWEIV